MADLTNLPNIEHEVLDFWEKEGIFDAVVQNAKDKPDFVFYDGPPFTSGLPHYGHIAQMAIKDAVLRYKTMQGYKVPRKIGWDTHGLPVEYELEKQLGLANKKAILEYGVDNFVNEARKIVLRYVDEWKGTMRRMGRWVNVDHPYTTMENGYIQSVWWAFGELYKKGLVYKAYRVGPYCPRCGTTLANFELNQGYKDDVADPGVFVSLPVIDPNGDYECDNLIIWTTTPWTLPSNAAVAVNPGMEYSRVLYKKDQHLYIVATSRISAVFQDGEYNIVDDSLLGEDLLGLKYQPPYRASDNKKAYKVIDGGEKVTSEEGTGLLHVAPAYGEVDFELGKKNDLPLIQSVDLDGTVLVGKIENMPEGIEGKFVKSADKIIMADLENRGLLIKSETIHHTYPFCWRCDSPLLYLPTTSWYVETTKIKDQLIAENNKINWQPEHIKDGRFGKWLDGVRDWAISRDRFWGAPIPIWECKGCGEIKVIGSAKELGLDEKFDLHRPHIDSIKLKCEKCSAEMQRVPFVFDCWFESGSMPYAQHHYPQCDAEVFDPAQHKGYPAEFIGEALDQTRGWFYTLHVLGVALFGEKAYKNVNVSGLILDKNGKKLSKKLRNYVDPNVLFEDQGVDALRLFLFTATRLGEEYKFDESNVSDVKRRWLIPLLNTLNYYELYKGSADDSETSEAHKLLDEYISERLNQVAVEIERAMTPTDSRSGYDVVTAARTFGPFIEDLSTWYVRLSRGRTDQAFYDTLRNVLIRVSKLMAPFTPFVAEHIYTKLRSKDEAKSVHMTEEFKPGAKWNEEAVAQMNLVREVVEAGREARAAAGIAIKQPLAELRVKASTRNANLDKLKALIEHELQIKSVEFIETLPSGDNWVAIERPNLTAMLSTELTDELKQEGIANVIRRTIQDMRKELKLQPSDAAEVYLENVTREVVEFVDAQLGESTRLVFNAPVEAKLTREVASDGQVIVVKLTF